MLRPLLLDDLLAETPDWYAEGGVAIEPAGDAIQITGNVQGAPLVIRIEDILEVLGYVRAWPTEMLTCVAIRTTNRPEYIELEEEMLGFELVEMFIASTIANPTWSKSLPTTPGRLRRLFGQKPASEVQYDE